MHNSAVPYDNDKPPNAGLGCKYMKCSAFLVTAYNQPTINPKDRRKTFSEILTRVHHRLPGLALLPVPLLGMMDSGRDPREGLFPFLGLIVSWLLAT